MLLDELLRASGVGGLASELFLGGLESFFGQPLRLQFPPDGTPRPAAARPLLRPQACAGAIIHESLGMAGSKNAGAQTR